MAEKKKMSDKVDKRRRGKLIVPGVEKPVYVSGKTQKEVDEKLAKAREKLITGACQKEIPFLEVVRLWWEKEKKPRTKSESTVRIYQSLLNNHVLPYFNEKQLIQAVTIDDLQGCIDQLKDLSLSQISHTMSILKGTYAYAMKHKYIQNDLSLYLIAPEYKEAKVKDFLTESQTQRLLTAAASEQYGIFIYLCYYLGLRAGEALALKWGDIDFKRKTVHVQRTLAVDHKISNGKTRASNRIVPIPSPLFSVLKERANMPTEYILQNPRSKYEGNLVSYSVLTWQWNQMMYRCGLAKLTPKYYEHQKQRQKEGKPPIMPRTKDELACEITPHWLRHNYVSMLYDAGVDSITASRIVGHSSYKITADLYTHISEQRKAQAAINLDNVFSKVAEKLPFEGVENYDNTRLPIDL